jgi:hypothetical protein
MGNNFFKIINILITLTKLFNKKFIKNLGFNKSFEIYYSLLSSGRKSNFRKK